MKTILYTVLLSYLFSVSIMSCTPEGYVKFQTFNEYELKGERTENIKLPYVFVKENKDTICVIKSNNRKEVMKYINKGKFWFYQESEKPQKYCCDIAISKRFIIKDTIFLYSYLPMPGTVSGITGEGIVIQTKKENTVIDNQKIIFDNENDLYEKIRDIVFVYKDSIPMCNKDKIFPKGCFQTYIKVFKDNGLLYLYDSKETSKLMYIYQLNSMGEFDLENSVMSPVPQHL